MTNEELLDKIMYSQVPTVTILERGEYRAELLRRLGAAVSASPQPRLSEVIERLNLLGQSLVAMDDLDPSDPMADALETAQCNLGAAIDLLKKSAQFFAAAPAQEPRIGEPCPTCERVYLGKMGPGDYSCCVCGMGMVEPCEHWKSFEDSAAQEQPVESSPQKGKP